ncbi:MAG: secretin N-terminal domain-containing protein [Burkholderiales bacterium]|nr:secretin N-terminal domain-containing protein [Burkholderiales bacterium]
MRLTAWVLMLAAGWLAGCASTPGGQGQQALQQMLEPASAPRRLPPALAQAVLEAARPAVTTEPPALPEPRFNLTVNHAPAREVLLGMVTGTPYSILVHPDVTGNLTLNLKQVTVPEALEAIRALYGIEYELQGRRVVIPSPSARTRVFPVNHLALQRQGASDIRVVSGSISLTDPKGGTGSRALETSSVQTQNHSRFWQELQDAIKALVGEAGQVVVSPQAGLVIVRAAPMQLKLVEDYLRASEAASTRQVMLEAKIVEVELKDEYQSGINWALLARGGKLRLGQDGLDSANNPISAGGSVAGMLTGGAPGAQGGLFGAAFVNSEFGAILNLLKTQGAVHVLSSPRIATLNNQKAVLKVGNDDFFVTEVTGGTAPTATTPGTPPNVVVQPFFSGIALDVTPQIDGQDNILLHVRPSVSRVAENRKVINLGSLGQMILPLASSHISETDSVVRLKDGQIVAIGGLMKQDHDDANNRLPGLGELPVLGELFGNTRRSSRKRELVVLIKPTILREAADWQQDYEAIRARLSAYGLPLEARR